MGCSNCSTCDVSESRGCGTSSVFDWLYQIDGPKTDNTNLLEVQFKGDRKDFYINSEDIKIKHGDWVAVQGDKSGHDIGKITMIGELVALQMQRKKIDREKTPLKKLYRLASETDKEKWRSAVETEGVILEKAKRIIQEANLEMKLSDVEFQGDKSNDQPIRHLKYEYSNKSLNATGRARSVSVLNSNIIDIRSDKKANFDDGGLNQIIRISGIPKSEFKEVSNKDLPKSKIIKREIFKKESIECKKFILHFRYCF